jgi:sulfatase modifying factor 1
MGSPANEPNRESDETQHQVTLSAFHMSKYEITNAQYAAFLNAKNISSNGRYLAGTYPTEALIYTNSVDENYNCGLKYADGQWIPVSGYENDPVTLVTWYGAKEFATYVGGTLPTEAQWEYACRGATTTPFNTGSCLSNTDANYYWSFPYNICTNAFTTYPGKTQAVGSYAANVYGLYDMHGNALEWCSDWNGTYPSNTQTNPIGAKSSLTRVVRGGSWYSFAHGCRSARRYLSSPDNYDDGLGFRVVFFP